MWWTVVACRVDVSDATRPVATRAYHPVSRPLKGNATRHGGTPWDAPRVAGQRTPKRDTSTEPTYLPT